MMGGAEEVRSAFGAGVSNYYRDYLDALMEMQRKEEAFRILERSRARSLLSMVAERDLIFT